MANLTSAGIAEAEVLRDAAGPAAPAAERAAERSYDHAAAAAATSWRRRRSDERRLVAAQIASSRRAPAGSRGKAGSATTAAGSGPLAQAPTLAAAVQARQRALERQARGPRPQRISQARSRS